MDFKAEDKITEIFEKLHVRSPQRPLPQETNDGGSGNSNIVVGPNHIYAPGGYGGSGGGGGCGGLDFVTVAMPNEMKQAAVDCATLALIRHNTDMDIAKYIRQEFSNMYNGTWQCIVGPEFGFNLLYYQHYINFHMGNKRFVLFNTS